MVTRMPRTESHVSAGILSPAQAAKRAEILELLDRAYWMEMETVMSYVANAAALDGIRAEEVAEALDADVGEELGHAASSRPGSRSCTARPRARSRSRPSRRRCSRPRTRRTSSR